LSSKKLRHQPAEKPLKRFFECSRLRVTGLKPGVNEMERFQTFEARHVTPVNRLTWRMIFCRDFVSFAGQAAITGL
jgi:hypothetical protein